MTPTPRTPRRKLKPLLAAAKVGDAFELNSKAEADAHSGCLRRIKRECSQNRVRLGKYIVKVLS